MQHDRQIENWLQIVGGLALSLCFLFLGQWNVQAEDLANRSKVSEQQNSEQQTDDVIFHRDILPLLSGRCFTCHGPDEGARQADLRLDLSDSAKQNREGLFVIKPGHPDQSEIIARLTSDDPDMMMPPPDSGQKPLTPEQVELIQRWIAQGAKWSTHWAYVPPTRPPVPEVAKAEWVRNPIDAFILHRLEQNQLAPSVRADRVTLLRRLSLDLIGLPPTIEEIDRFLADETSDAYQRQVKRLIDSPHFGERWGRVWLDAARYADSDGFEKDKPREVWFYRDWVINALNNDLPYDQFIIEQIAGDLLPHATQDQIVATGFLRNSMLNEEGGVDPEEFRMQAMFDRMDTIGKSILGFTVQCSQCHSHKYDPFTQHEYYSMFAFLNNCHEAQPTVYTAEQQQKREELFNTIAAIENNIKVQDPAWSTKMAEWEEVARASEPNWTVLPIENAGNNSQRYFDQGDGSLLAQGYAPSRVDAPFSATTDLEEVHSFRLEVLNHPNLPAGGPGRSVNGLFALTEFTANAVSVKDPSQSRQITFKRATADFSNARKQLEKPYVDQEGNSVGVTGSIDYAIDGDPKTAWGVDAGPGRRNEPREAVFVADGNAAFEGGTTFTFTLTQRHGGWNSDDNQTLCLGRFRISALREEADADLCPDSVRKIFSIPSNQRSDSDNHAVFSYWRTTVPDWKAENDQIAASWQQHPEGTTQFVLQERKVTRPTYLLERGDFLKPTDSVDPNVPGFLNPLTTETTLHPKNADEKQADSQHLDRLEFAKWLVDRKSPTAARAIVNRIWQAYFGTGLVDTPEDLGTTGSLPSHPELIDWLSVELMENHWSLKHIHQLIVDSNTYQQSSQVNAELLSRDPQNRLLSRSPRFRVDAEIVRDIFLAASGLLNRQVGGPSVFPPAPEFLFQKPASYGPKVWDVDTGPDRYRRGLYTFRFRSVPHPALQAFDAPSGEIATVQRSRSNTPMQALVTLNEPLANECARALAIKVVSEGGTSNEDRLTYGFRRCVARTPSEGEQELLLNLLAEQTSRFQSGSLDPKLVLFSDDSETMPVATGVSPADLAAWTVISRVLLNLDETITRE